MNAILSAYLDAECGTDPELLEARARMPEPCMNPGPRCCVAVQVKNIVFIRQPVGFTWDGLVSEQFERDEVLAPGVSFWVWRAVRDGKIYL